MDESSLLMKPSCKWEPDYLNRKQKIANNFSVQQGGLSKITEGWG